MGLFFIPLDPPWPMFYVRALTLEDMAEMKSGINCVDNINHHGDYINHLNGNLFVISFSSLSLLTMYFTMLMFRILGLQATAAEAPIPSKTSLCWEKSSVPLM